MNNTLYVFKLTMLKLKVSGVKTKLVKPRIPASMLMTYSVPTYARLTL
jgi:hypothetical protein